MKKLLIPLFAAGAALAFQPAMAADGEALFKSKPCAACHNVDMKMVGPALKDVAAKYAGQEGAAALLAGHIKNGISGVWVRSRCRQTRLPKKKRSLWPSGCLA